MESLQNAAPRPIKALPRRRPASSPPTLDAKSFPHIIDRIIKLSDFDSLLALRCVNQELRHRADTVLCSHLVVRAPKSKRDPGTHFHTLSRARFPRYNPVPLPIPGFAFYFDSADDAYNSKHACEHYDSDDDENYAGREWGWSAWGTHSHSRRGGGGPPFIQQHEFKRPRSGEEIDRAWGWCVAALDRTRVLDIHGDTFSAIQPLLHAGALDFVKIVRVFPDSHGKRVLAVRIPCSRLLVSLSLRMQFRHGGEPHSAPATIPAFGIGVERLTLWITYYARHDHADETIMGFGISPALRDVVIILEECYGNDDFEPPEPHPRPFGVLDDIMQNTVPHLDRVRVTIVDLNPKSGPMLGVVDHTLYEDDTIEELSCDHRRDKWNERSWEDMELANWEPMTESLKSQFLAQVERSVRQRAKDWARDGRGWSEERIEAAVANVRFMHHSEWIAEVKEKGEECDTKLETLL